MPSRLIKEKLYDGRTTVKWAPEPEKAAAAEPKAAQAAQAAKSAAPAAKTEAAKAQAPVLAAETAAKSAAAKTAAAASLPAAPAAPAAAKGASLAEKAAEAAEAELKRLYEAAARSAEENIDRQTEAAAERLRRAEEEAAASYKDERARIALDEARALDNAALYASLRGDAGGIGLAQYGSIMGAAERSRALVAAERRKLAAQTAREIEELRAEGGYKKADALLELAQERLGKLTELYKWAAERSLDERELESRVERWRSELELKRESLEREAGSGSAGATERDAEELFEAMRASGKPYTWLTANARKYGVYDSSPTVFAEIMKEYRLWAAAGGG